MQLLGVLGVLGGEGRVREQVREKLAALLGLLVEDQPGPGQLGPDRQVAGARRGFEHDVPEADVGGPVLSRDIAPAVSRMVRRSAPRLRVRIGGAERRGVRDTADRCREGQGVRGRRSDRKAARTIPGSAGARRRRGRG